MLSVSPVRVGSSKVSVWTVTIRVVKRGVGSDGDGLSVCVGSF